MDQDQTRIVTQAHGLDERLDERVHCLEMVDGRTAVRRRLISSGGVTIGRAAPSDIILADSEVSRTHCRLVLDGDQLTVSDLASTNGTFVDGARVQAPEAAPLTSLENAALGGLGIALVRKLAASVAYQAVQADEPLTDIGERMFAPHNRLRVSVAIGR